MARLTVALAGGSIRRPAWPATARATADAAVDLDGAYVPRMREAGHVVELVRPDHYLFGAASSMIELSGLVDDLRLLMTAEHPTSVAATPAHGTEGQPS